MYHSILLLLISVINIISSSHLAPGHLKPFGTVGSLINIEAINGEYPNVLKLFTYYIPKSEPILSRQVLINDIYYNIWKTDEQLENEVDGLSKININVESLIQHQRIQMKFGEFFDKYQKQHLYFADNVPEILRKYLVVPQPFQCDAVSPILQSPIFVMNGINTSPLMFNEEYDSLLCLFRGKKRVVLVNTNKYPDVRQIVAPENRESRGPSLNLDKVDLNQFPALAHIDYHVANLTAGDCLFIPTNWIFQERSLDSTISIVYNTDHHQALDIDLNQVQNCSTNNTFDSSFTFDQLDWSTMDNGPQNLREVMINLINSKSNNFEKWQEAFSKQFSFDFASDPEGAAIFDEFYGIIDFNGDGEVTMSELELINGAHQHHVSDILYEMVQLISDKQKSNTSKQVGEDDENAKEISENEDIDEHLHLEDYKSEL